jgi:hypothetical protein
MFGQSKRKTIMIFLTIVAFLLLIYWKWPYPLSHYFKTDRQPIGAAILLDDGRFKQVDLNNKEAIAPLYNAIQRTSVLHLNWYKFINLTDNKLYTVYLFSRSDDGSLRQEICAFNCDEAGYVYMNGCKYAVVGHSEFIPILEQIFEENDAKLITN